MCKRKHHMTTFFDLPPEVRFVIWSIHKQTVFKDRCTLLNEQLQRSHSLWHVGVHSSYSPVAPPRFDVTLHIDGPSGKVYCFSKTTTSGLYRATRTTPPYHETFAYRRIYQQYDNGILVMDMDDKTGVWESTEPRDVLHTHLDVQTQQI